MRQGLALRNVELLVLHMPKLEDILIDRPDRNPFRSIGRRRRSRAPVIAAISLLAALAIGAGAWYLLRSRDAADPQMEAAATDVLPEAEAVAPTPVADPPLDLPALDASDAFLRDLVARLSSHPQLAAWLVNDNLVRRFVATVADLAEGMSPAPHLRFLTPGQPFGVQEAGGRLVIDPASYRRYDLLTGTFVSLDTEGTARLYRQLHPLFEEAYQELGIATRSFDDAMALAMGNLLAVNVPDRLQVVPSGATEYEFGDPRLEARGGAEKHLLRMGPENARRVQAKLRELADALAIQIPNAR
jgi:hypothetical protein